MHEMSVAISIVQSVCDITADQSDGRVSAVNIRVGAMSGVIPEALTFAWTPAVRGTPLEKTTLQIEFVPAVVHCPSCEQDVELPGQRLVCPRCQARVSTLLRGRELELLSLEIHDEPHPHHATHP